MSNNTKESALYIVEQMIKTMQDTMEIPEYKKIVTEHYSEMTSRIAFHLVTVLVSVWVDHVASNPKEAESAMSNMMKNILENSHAYMAYMFHNREVH